MKSHRQLNPFDVPKVFRNFLYDHVVLAWETDQVSIIPAVFSKRVLHSVLALRVEMVSKLSEVERRALSPWGPDEFLTFYVDGKGYESLFKRLRDTFAHGHYGSEKRGWITIWHRYKGRNEKRDTTRLFARLRQSTLKHLVEYLDTTGSQSGNQ